MNFLCKFIQEISSALVTLSVKQGQWHLPVRVDEIKCDVLSTWHWLASAVGSDNVCDKETAVALACQSLFRTKVGILSQELRQGLVAPSREG